MDFPWPWYLAATFGMPVFGAVLLLVAVAISSGVYFSSKTGRSLGADDPKMLFLIALALIVIPTLLFLLGWIELMASAGGS